MTDVITKVDPAEIKQFLAEHATKVPHTLFGWERQAFIGNDIVKPMELEKRTMLKAFLDDCLLMMREKEASDIDMGGLGTRGHIWFRIHGEKKPMLELGEFETREFDILIQSVLLDSQRAYLYEHRNLDFSYEITNDEGTQLYHRADAYFDMDSMALNMRAISTSVRPYSSYQFHPNLTRTLSLAHTHEGLVLVTGITGSGKSTTLDAIIDMNNSQVEGHIIIIASPVEFVHTPEKCIVRHREVGRDVQSFKHGTIEALRQDPDIIVIGEMRDPETIMAALEVADSGHKVLSTLHTSSAVESIDRIIGEVPPIEQDRVRNRLADVLRCVISQKLLPSADGRRIMAKETMIMTPSIRAAIKNNNVSEIYQMINEGLKYGMSTMEQDLKQLVQERKITRETAMNYSNNKRMMQQLLQTF